jgi:GNAT superfamily N-acetyltransferase
VAGGQASTMSDDHAVFEFRDLRTTRDEGLLEAVHRDLFLPAFPDPDEQEGPSDWVPRLWRDPSPPRPEQHGVVAGIELDEERTRVLAGFAFVERYRESRCALLSYIAVDPRWRGRRLARTLFESALGSAREAAIADGGPLLAVFAEIHDPSRVDKIHDVINPADRVRIMAHLGAMLVPIDYVQPALGVDGERSHRLMLIAFPQHGEHVVDADVVRSFLLEYYGALAVPDPAGDPDLIRITAELGDGPVELAPLESALEFEDFGIALHFVAKRSEKSEPTSTSNPPGEVNPFASFEEDLFSYRYSSGRHRLEDTVFETHPMPLDERWQTIDLSIPAEISYESEGEERKLPLPPPHVEGERRRRLALKASCTHFPRSDYDVFHLIFVSARREGQPPAPEFLIDEYDLVALSKLWQGTEKSKLEEEIRIRPARGESLTISELVLELFGMKDSHLRLGTIQLITHEHTRGASWDEIWEDLEALSGDAHDELRHEPQLVGLGGILQGILDFRAIDAWELAEVFAGCKNDSSLLGIHKGTLLCVMADDRSYSATVKKIGLSPYLLLPQAMLLHNEMLLDVAAKCAQAARSERNPRRLESSVNEIGGTLENYLPNVFHYPQERWLFRRGERSRDHHVRRARLDEERANLDTLWKQKVAKRAQFAEDFRNALLVWLAFLPVYPFVAGDRGLEVASFLGFLVLAIVTLLAPRRSEILKGIQELLTATEDGANRDAAGSKPVMRP